MTTQPAKRRLYGTFAGQLPRLTGQPAVPEVDGRYWLADLYSARIDDGVLAAIRTVAQIHLGGGRLRFADETSSLAFLCRLRCVDSLCDYLILALQVVAEQKPYAVEAADRAALCAMTADREALPPDESGYLDPGDELDLRIPVVRLVHLSDLLAHEKLSLSIPTRLFSLESAIPSDPTQPRTRAPGSDPLKLAAAPDYCFVSHSWVDLGMPDTEDGKFYRVLLLMALDVYLQTGIEYFWIDYLCVTQDPAAQAEKCADLASVPAIVASARTFMSVCLEIYQYHSSAWCAFETLTFIATNPYCQPLDFIRHERSNYRFGMNLSDPSTANANDKILYSFTDQPLECGREADIPFLQPGLERAIAQVKNRLWRLGARGIKAAAGMGRAENLGVLVTEPLLQFLRPNFMGDEQRPTSRAVIEGIDSQLSSLGYRRIAVEDIQRLAAVLDNCWTMMFVLAALEALNRDHLVRVRRNGAYDVPPLELTTSYAFHNQRGT